MKNIIGTSAYPGSGQDILADLVSEKFDYKKYSIGDFIRNIAIDKNIEPTRENLQELRKLFDFENGREYFPKMIVELVKAENKNIIITGMRRKEEYEIFKAELYFNLLFVTADYETRVKRVLKRGEIKDPKTVADFILQEKKEAELFDLPFLELNADYKFDCSKEWNYYVDNYEWLLSQIPFLK